MQQQFVLVLILADAADLEQGGLVTIQNQSLPYPLTIPGIVLGCEETKGKVTI